MRISFKHAIWRFGLGWRYRFWRLGLQYRLLLREPVGWTAVLLLFYVIGLAPQTPDMLAGMVVGEGSYLQPQSGWWRSLSFPVFAIMLGLVAWYWTRAALLAPFGLHDSALYSLEHARLGFDGPFQCRAAEHDLFRRELSRDAPEALAAFDAISKDPLAEDLSGCREQDIAIALNGAPLLAFALIGSLLNLLVIIEFPGQYFMFFVGFVAYLILYLRLESAERRTVLPPDWVWRWRTSAVFAAAPWGWRVALGIMAASVCGVGLVAVFPEVIESSLDTPVAALAAVTLLVGPLVVALAFLRDLLVAVARGLIWLGRRILPLKEGSAPDPAGIHVPEIPHWSTIPGLLLFLVCVSGFWRPLGEASGLYAVRTTGVSLSETNTLGKEQPAGTLRRPGVEEALQGWLDARRTEQAALGPMPVVIVAAEGGASRAAVWLLSAMRLLDNATEGKFGRHLFAISSVSGGSLGAVTYLQAVRAHGGGSPWLRWDHPRVKAGLERLGDSDLLAASIATFFLNDMVEPLAGCLWAGVPDRGEALEHAFERHWAWKDALAVPQAQARDGLIALWATSPPGTPHLLLNGTDRETGRRLITSTLRFNPADDLFVASDDLLAIMGADVPGSTAVTNSARFPYVSPAGRITGRHESPRQVLDGGYFENYGARTAAELARRVGEISVARGLDLLPVVVVVSNDADASRATAEKMRELRRGKPNRTLLPALEETAIHCRKTADVQDITQPAEIARERSSEAGGYTREYVAPLVGFFATRTAHGQDALQSLRRELCPRPGENAQPRLFHIALPRPEPGVEAAPMNWVLNPMARDYLLLVAPTVVFNRDQAAALSALFANISIKGRNHPRLLYRGAKERSPPLR